MTEMASQVGSTITVSNDNQNLANICSSVEDLFRLLESTSKRSVVQEIKQLINEQCVPVIPTPRQYVIIVTIIIILQL